MDTISYSGILKLDGADDIYHSDNKENLRLDASIIDSHIVVNAKKAHFFR